MTGLRAAAALAALALVAAASAQTVEVGGWALAEGAVVRSASVTGLEAVVRGPGGEVAFGRRALEVATTTIDRVEAGRLMRAVQRLESASAKATVDGAPAPPGDPDPLLHRAVVIERTADGWRKRADGWQPTPDQLAALDEAISLDDAEYPTRMTVGETVVVPDSALRAVYLGAAPGPHRLTVRLDSVGTFEGGPAAFLTQTVGVTVGDPGETMRMDMTARIVRRLDWRLDVRTEWEGPVRFEQGGLVIEGRMTQSATQTATLPDDR
ncbi:hypothetical protein [Rubrivirga sp. IMCC45206]|uniref:hypothetical protein n=1 Tax=Rubrivirga sp. IMCC45206 TaxID=3391614 RepID=UPI0039901EC5